MKTSYLTICTALFFTFLFAGTIYAQTTSIQLQTNSDTLSSFQVLSSTGITKLRVNSDGGFYLGGQAGSGDIPTTGAGMRLMWYPKRGAFRAGYIDGTQWDNANIGDYSTAMGFNTAAHGDYSVAMGEATADGIGSIAIGVNPLASGNFSTAIGNNTTASGYGASALGYYTVASGDYSTAMGYASGATGIYSTAIGDNSNANGNSSVGLGWFATASGDNSIAMGSNTTASGMYSTAMGRNTTASGNYSTAMGFAVSTNNHSGSFIIGDSSLTFTTSTTANQMIMRFAGGYRLYSNAACTSGVYMNGDVNGWTNYCDRNRKENFCSIDGEQLLLKIRDLPISEWNYKGTDPTIKYIGPVAQDFHAAFHLGGTDSLGINSICIDGVNIAAIQALEKRTSELHMALDELKTAKEKVVQLQTALDQFKSELDQMKQTLNDLTENTNVRGNSDLSLNEQNSTK